MTSERPSEPANALATPDSEPFWAGIVQSELWLQRCPDTGQLIFPPTPFSPFGRRRAMRWEQLSGRGRIWSYVVAHPPLTPWFEAVAPYVSVLVEIDEDASVRLPGWLVDEGGGLGSVDARLAAIGHPVALDRGSVDPESPVAPRWVLAE